MTELVFVRHGQASFGAANYDKLSERGHLQARALGKALALQGLAPVRFATGAQVRHRETLDGVAEGLRRTADAQRALVLPGLNEFPFGALLACFMPDEAARPALKADPAAYFRAMRDTVLAWQRDDLSGPPETYADFRARVAEAKRILIDGGEGPVLAVSSGGPIALMVALALEAPETHMIGLQMQIRNCAVTRFIVSREGAHLSTFNETPHIHAANAAELLSHY